jgi:hypothetical protein
VGGDKAEKKIEFPLALAGRIIHTARKDGPMVGLPGSSQTKPSKTKRKESSYGHH